MRKVNIKPVKTVALFRHKNKTKVKSTAAS